MTLQILCLIVLSLLATTISAQDVIMPPPPGLYVRANLRVEIDGDEHIFWLDGSESTGDIDSYMWELVEGDDADFTTKKVQFPYWPQKGGFYKWSLTICDSAADCISTEVETTIKKFKACQSDYQNVMQHISPHAEFQIADWDPPRCTKNGLYERVQCQWFSPKPCYCVHRRTGERRFGDLAFLGIDDYHCRREPRPCKRYLLESQPSPWFPEEDKNSWLPKCRRSGWYKPKQCDPNLIVESNGAVGQCWCVDKNGEEVVGTRTLMGERLNCRRPPTECEILRREALFGIDPFYTPTCRRNGKYKKKQCRINQNMETECYCVVPSTGAEVTNTVGDENIRC